MTPFLLVKNHLHPRVIFFILKLEYARENLFPAKSASKQDTLLT